MENHWTTMKKISPSQAGESTRATLATITAAYNILIMSPVTVIKTALQKSYLPSKNSNILINNVFFSVCLINRTSERIQNTPLIVGDEPSTWPKFVPEYEFLTVKPNQKVKLVCSTQDQPQNTFKTHPTSKIINAECLNEDKFIVDEKTYKFEDLKCKEHVKPSIVLPKKPCMKSGETIEIGFKLNNGFLEVYEVCYSNADHQTLFTKVVMSYVNIGNKVESSFKLNDGIKAGKNNVGDITKCRYNQRWLVNPVDVAFGPAQTATLSNKYNAVPVFEPCDSSRVRFYLHYFLNLSFFYTTC